MTTPTKVPPSATRPARETRSGDTMAFKAIALPAVAAATRRKPQGRAERRTGIVLDPMRCTD